MDVHDDRNVRGMCRVCHAWKSGQEAAAARRKFSTKRESERHPGLL
jgi:hypothetical protein